jgi:uncharacterized DUF497 family protein
MYITSMRWTWHQPKSDATQADRGFGFNDVIRMFEGPVFLESADRKGERRIQAIGIIEGRYFSVIYTKRGKAPNRCRHIISARRARDNEKAKYDARR